MNENETTKENIKKMVLKYIKEKRPEAITINQHQNILEELELPPEFEEITKEAITELYNNNVIITEYLPPITDKSSSGKDLITNLQNPKIDVEGTIIKYITDKKPKSIKTESNKFTKELNFPPEFDETVKETLTNLCDKGTIKGNGEPLKNSASGKNLVVSIIEPTIY